MTRVAVVGAGITGLSLAHYLRKRGVDHRVFEASDHPGGVIASDRIEGVVVEKGPQRARLTDEIRGLVEDTGLGPDVIRADDDLPLYVYADGRLRRVPRSPAEFVNTDLLSVRGKLRLLAEPLTAPGRPDETAAELFTRKFGREAYENLVGPVFGGTYGSDPAAMPARHALDSLLRLEEREGSLLRPGLKRAFGLGDGETPPAVTFEDGMAALPRALYGANEEAVALSTPVERIERADGENEDRSAYAVRHANGTYRADRVVITTPADVAGDMLEPLVPTAAAALRRLNYNPLAMVYLEAVSNRRGLGYQVRRDEPLDTLGVSWNGSTFGRGRGRDDLFTVFLGGMDRPELVDAADEALEALAATEFEAVMRCPARPLGVSRTAHGFPAYDASWDALDDVVLPEGVTLATNYTARMGVPGRVREAERLAERFAGAGDGGR